jgi:hypothetical protein
VVLEEPLKVVLPAAHRLARPGGPIALADVTIMPPLAMPADDPALAIRDVVNTTLRRRLVAVTRANPPAPALTALLTAVMNQAGTLQTRR